MHSQGAVAGRYDRQLRLWGPWGQSELEKSYILFLGCHPVWVEALESLAASGLQDYIIVDDKLLSTSDLTHYYCLTSHGDDVGKRARADLVKEYMSEINPACAGSTLHINPAVFAERICNAEGYMMSFLSGKVDGQLILVAVNQPISLLRGLQSTFSKQINVSLFATFSVGPFGFLHFASDFHMTWDSRDPKYEYNLCLECIFPRLKELELKLFNGLRRQVAYRSASDEMTQPISIPYIVLLVRAVRLFIEKHSRMPSAPDRRLLEEVFYLPDFSEGNDINPECLEEAIKNIYRVCRTYELPDELRHCFVAKRSITKQEKNRKTLILLDALEIFYNTHGRLPVKESVPDMIAETDYYLELKACYREQASADLSELRQYMLDGGWEAMEEEMIPTFLQGLDFSRLALTNESEGSMVGEAEIDVALRDVRDTEMLLETEPIAPPDSLGWELSFGVQSIPSLTNLYLCVIAYSRLLEYRAKGLAPINSDEFLDLAYNKLAEKFSSLESLSDKRTLTHFKQCVSLEPQHATTGLLGGVLAGEILKVATRVFLPEREQAVLWEVTAKSFSLPFWEDAMLSTEL